MEVLHTKKMVDMWLSINTYKIAILMIFGAKQKEQVIMHNNNSIQIKACKPGALRIDLK